MQTRVNLQTNPCECGVICALQCYGRTEQGVLCFILHLRRAAATAQISGRNSCSSPYRVGAEFSNARLTPAAAPEAHLLISTVNTADLGVRIHRIACTRETCDVCPLDLGKNSIGIIPLNNSECNRVFFLFFFYFFWGGRWGRRSRG